MSPVKKLILPALKTFLIGALVLGLFIFLPAWTLNYWQGWVFLFVFLILSNGIGIVLSLRDPVLLERRKKFGPAVETKPVQKIIMGYTLVGVAALLIVPAMDHRFGWSAMPALIPVLGNALLVAAFYYFYLVFKENSFGGSTIEVFEDQKVISTGPYAFVRHPMYQGVLIMCLGVPLALGSWWGLLVVLATLPGLIWRILDEERMLKRELAGYAAYMQRVRYRLLPHVW